MRKALSCTVIILIMSTIMLLSSCGSDNSDKITLAEYNQIENGMTYDEVKGIIGSDGEVSAESGDKGAELYTIIYTWQGSGSTGANASLTFQGNPAKIVGKAQAGLK